MSGVALLLGIVAAGGLLVIAGEILARLAVRRSGYYVHPRWERLQMRLDREAVPMLEPVVRFEVNGDGERGDPVPEDRMGLYRVLVAGGSATECMLLDQDSAWPAVMQRLLNHPDSLETLGARRVHVGNIGRSLTPVEIIHRLLGRTLPRYERLDLLILMVGVSDAIQWLERDTPARITEPSRAENEGFAENPNQRFEWLSRKWALRRLCGLWWRRWARPLTRRDACGNWLIEFRRRRQRAQLINTVPDPAPMLDYLEKNLRAVVSLAEAKGARVILLRQPWFDKDMTPLEESLMWNFSRGRLCKEVVQGAYYTHQAMRALLRKADARVARVAGELGIEQVNLLSRVEPSVDTFYDFVHFTAAGAQVVAHSAADAVLRRSPVTGTADLLAVAAAVGSSATAPAAIMVSRGLPHAPGADQPHHDLLLPSRFTPARAGDRRPPERRQVDAVQPAHAHEALHRR